MARCAAQGRPRSGGNDPRRRRHRPTRERGDPGRGPVRKPRTRQRHRRRRGDGWPAGPGHHCLRCHRRHADLAQERLAVGLDGRRPASSRRRGQPCVDPRQKVGYPAGGAALAGVDTVHLARDQTWFLAIFAVKVTLGLVAFAIKPWLGLAFFAVYGVYFVKEMAGNGEQASGDGLEPLKLQPRRGAPGTLAVTAQILVTLAVIFGASQLFVKQLEWAGPALGLPAAVVALLLSPVATELPEIMNAVIWVRQGKKQLALANISGAMMIQATIPSGIAILFTPWKFNGPLILAGAVTMASVSYVLWLLRTHTVTASRLTAAAGFYAVFAVGLVLII